MAEALRPLRPVYVKVTPTWLVEARRRPVEELLQLKWHNLLGVRAFGVTKEEFIQCLKDDACLGALIRGICEAVKAGHVKAKREYLRSWLKFCVHYW